MSKRLTLTISKILKFLSDIEIKEFNLFILFSTNSVYVFFKYYEFMIHPSQKNGNFPKKWKNINIYQNNFIFQFPQRLLIMVARGKVHRVSLVY